MMTIFSEKISKQCTGFAIWTPRETVYGNTCNDFFSVRLDFRTYVDEIDKLDGIETFNVTFNETELCVTALGDFKYTCEEASLLFALMTRVGISPKMDDIFAICGIYPDQSNIGRFESDINNVDADINNVDADINNVDADIKNQPFLSETTGSPTKYLHPRISKHNTQMDQNKKSTPSLQQKKHKRNLEVGVDIGAVAVLATLVIITIGVPGLDLYSGTLTTAANLYSTGYYDLALREYKSVRATDNSNFSAEVGQGYSLINLARYNEALSIFDEILEIDEQNSAAIIGKYKTLIAMEKHSEAEKHLDTYSKKSPVFVKSQQNNISLLKSYQSMLDKNPVHVIALNGMGDVHTTMGLYAKANEYFDNVLSIDPSNVNGLNGKGNISFYLSQFTQSKAYYHESLNHVSDNINAIVGLGNIFVADKEYESAIQMFKRAHQIDSTHPNPLLGWTNTLIALERFSDAEEKINDIFADNPDYYLAQLSRGNIYLEQNEYDKALEKYQYVIDKEPSNITAMLAKGGVLHLMQKYGDAMIVFDNVLDYEPNNRKAMDGFTESKNALEWTL